MSRAALLPTVGDPYVLRFWLDYYERIWQSEIQRLYVNLTTPEWTPPSIVRACETMIEAAPKTTLIRSKMSNHGRAIRHLVEICEDSEYLVLVEDDAPITKAGALDWAFDHLEEDATDILGVARLSGSKEIWDATIAKYGPLEFQPACDQGPNWWPCFFFAKRQTFLRTDCNFSAKGWPVGEKIPFLDLVPTETKPIGGDTMVWMSIQLRALRVRAKSLCGFHSYCSDLDDRGQRQHLWQQDRPWFHIGSLSTLVGTAPHETMFAPAEDFTAYMGRMQPLVAGCTSLQAELTRRMAWVRTIFNWAKDRAGVPADWQTRYEENMAATVSILALPTARIDVLMKAYQELLPQ